MFSVIVHSFYAGKRNQKKLFGCVQDADVLVMHMVEVFSVLSLSQTEMIKSLIMTMIY